MRISIPVVPAIVVYLAACGDGEPPGATWDGEVRDSAGIEIVVNRGPASWTESDGWTATVDLRIGEADGNDTIILGRVADVAVDRRGLIHVLDQLAQRIRTFDAGGGYLRSAGGPGRGPGELSRFAAAALVAEADTLYVPDYAQSRVNVYDPDGNFTRTIRLPSPPGGRSWALDSAGRIVLRGVTISRDDEGRFQTWDALLRTRADGGLDTLLVFAYEKTDIGTRDNLRVPMVINQAFWTQLGGGGFAWSALDRNEVYVHDAAGRLFRIIRRDAWQPRDVTDADRATMVGLLRDKLGALGGDVSAAHGRNVEAPEVFPSITGLHPGPMNTLWVQRMGEASEIDPMAINAADRSEWLGGATWDVLDAHGRWLGSVELPRRFRVTRLTSDYIYGIARGDLDVEGVLRLTLTRP